MSCENIIGNIAVRALWFLNGWILGRFFLSTKINKMLVKKIGETIDSLKK